MNAQPASAAPAYALRYSFVFRYQHERIFSIDIPLQDLLDAELSVKAVRELVADDYDLHFRLLGDYLHRYEEMASNWEYWSKNLERERESIRIVQVES
ncbi:hypothetical protein [Arthrobacter caoxuetaonis]|uniref:Uncharacterized protein n=1 Tax=Arthrobacter caoxuetaonis TaxID=2886935 RepID=A0A9X1MHK8_9MICC|nr:hypothetical protein [Arthrobacter caoxuetaonis]MCC3299390.1 hypothetical protein [Arthrobacter caoxuetaonis]USQ59117.1 hypothetical protein NF551_18600 [Arthrobacter caoxuetaonis]